MDPWEVRNYNRVTRSWLSLKFVGIECETSVLACIVDDSIGRSLNGPATWRSERIGGVEIPG